MNLKEKIDVQKIKGKINEIFNSKWFVIIIGILIFLKTILTLRVFIFLLSAKYTGHFFA